jgi:DNA-binding transcriptional regulator YdaS (Cro superfamily)
LPTRLNQLVSNAVGLNDEHIPQYMIAGHCGIHPTTFSEYVRGIREIPWQHRRLIAEYFGVSEDELTEEVDVSN